ncbi:MAG: UbiA family prenyltransferase [bacterium]|nr:UbiA family prenyltransferase [bacterium]
MFFQLFRVQQWYKNLLIFLPLVFAGLLGDPKSIFLTIVGFFALCLMSSTNYILNDILDREKDKIHPEKKDRPIASGKISIMTATILAFLLATSSLVLAFFLSEIFFVLLLIFFFLTQLYSLYFKEELFVDIIFISTNFVLRAMAGSFILDIRLSPWLILCTFFLSLFIVVGKRKADISILKNKASLHKKVLQDYEVNITNTLMIIATTALLLSYSLYSFLSIYPKLVYSLPFALYVILRYFYLIETKSVIARHPEQFYKDTRLLVGILLWVALLIFLLYFL